MHICIYVYMYICIYVYVCVSNQRPTQGLCNSSASKLGLPKQRKAETPNSVAAERLRAALRVRTRSSWPNG